MSTDDTKGTFLNRRDWSSFVSELPIAATLPNLKNVIASSRDWFTVSAAQATTWLAHTSAGIKDKFSAG
jgi:hypothetical protein